MRIISSAIISVLFVILEGRVQPTLAMRVHAKPQDFILGMIFFRANRSVFDFEHNGGLNPIPITPRVPFRQKNDTNRTTPTSCSRSCSLTKKLDEEDAPRLMIPSTPTPELSLLSPES